MVPQWLQPAGRMHPMILHFPIVLLLLSMVMEFFRFKSPDSAQEFYQKFTSNLLLVGVISSGLTSIMGLLLSQEGGYSSDALAWHKWSGVFVFFVASFIYTSREFVWYKPLLAKAGAVITTLCLVLAGHFGAELTHGDNFIWQPVLAYRQKVVPLEEALLFDHVIKPVFENKCVSCHNPDKMKGKLSLADSASLSKGGKAGDLFEGVTPQAGLLFRRIHLPLEEKKHMPPSGKPQLTLEEKTLIDLWIKAEGKFTSRVTELPSSDSLRLLATAFLQAGQNEEEKFDFAAADATTLKKLNTNYCVVSPLAKESPALAVNIYNRVDFKPETLDRLKDIKTQVISLELSRMPVKNEDLKKIARLENLQRLNLNFTDVTGEGLPTLSSLKKLSSLYLTGTRVNFQDLKRYLPAFKNLHTLALWDTELSAPELEDLEDAFKHIHFLGGFRDDGSHPIKLNVPQVKNKSVVFEDSLPLQLFHPVKGVDIRFTTDGRDPDSLNSTLFNGQTVLHESTAIKACAYKAGWLSSNVAWLNVYRSGHKPDSIILRSKLNRVHQAKGAQTFFDHQLGTFNANSPAWANNWAGFIKIDMDLLLTFETPKTISSVALNTLVETETTIFPPVAIEIWGGNSENNMQLIGKVKPELPKDYSKPFIKIFNCEFKPRNVTYLKVIAKPVMKLPEWHRNKDRPALLLIDEIFIN